MSPCGSRRFHVVEEIGEATREELNGLDVSEEGSAHVGEPSAGKQQQWQRVAQGDAGYRTFSHAQEQAVDAVDVHEVELVLAVAVAASSRCSGPLAGKQQQWQRVAQGEEVRLQAYAWNWSTICLEGAHGIAALRSGWWMSAMMSGPKRSFQGYKTMFAHGPAQWRGVAAEHVAMRLSTVSPCGSRASPCAGVLKRLGKQQQWQRVAASSGASPVHA